MTLEILFPHSIEGQMNTQHQNHNTATQFSALETVCAVPQPLLSIVPLPTTTPQVPWSWIQMEVGFAKVQLSYVVVFFPTHLSH